MFRIRSYIFLVNITLLFGDTPKRDVFFTRMPFFDDHVCKHLFCVFKVYNESIVYCTILCKSNNQCTGFFYNPSTEQCSGSSIEATYVDSADIVNHSSLGGEVGSIYFRDQSATTPEEQTITVFINTDEPTTPTQTSLPISAPLLTIPESSTIKTNGGDPTSLEKQTMSTQRMTMPVLITPPSNNEMGGKPVYDIIYDVTFKGGFDGCQKIGARVVWIEDETENKLVVSVLNTNGVHIAYIGHTLGEVSSNLLYYPTKEKVLYSDPWLIQTASVERNCTAILTANGNWMSQICTKEQAVICERT